MTLVTRSQDLAAFCARACAEPFITLDTEFMRETTYWPRLCLIQIGLKAEAVAIDPLAPELDLQPVWDLLANGSVLKVFHACKQDMEIFLNRTGALPTPVFDSQIAAMMLGIGEQVGYDKLIQRVLNRQIDKTSQFSNWALRPLDAQQIAYALGDVTHLHEAYEVLRADLQARGREDWVQEEMQPYTQLSTYELDPAQAWRRLKIKNHSKPFLAALYCLARWREQFAQNRNLPRSWVLRDDSLVDLALRRPKSPQALVQLRGLSEGLAKGKTGAAILAALAQAERLSGDQIPQLVPRPPSVPGAGARADMLRTLLKICAEVEAIAPRALASACDLEALARDRDAEVKCMRGWRRSLFGARALDLLDGKLWLGLRDGQSVLLTAADLTEQGADPLLKPPFHLFNQGSGGQFAQRGLGVLD